MLERLNKIIILILVTLLILSFGIWGIGDVIQGQAVDRIAKVGKTTVKRSEFEAILSSQIRRLSSSYDMQNESLRLMAEQRTLNNLINERLYKLESQDMGVIISDQQMKESIKNNTLYHKDGVFRKDIFKNYVRTTGLSEYDYIEGIMKPEISEGLLNEVLYDDAMLPKKMIDMIMTHEGEIRIAKLLTIPKLFKKDVATPTDEELNKYYEENKFAFVAPEYRKFSMVEITFDTISDELDLSDVSLREEYNERISEFVTDEKRTVQMMTFNDKKDADAALKKVLDGGDFMKVAIESGVSEASVNSLGTIVFTDIEKNQFYPEKMADTIFNMKEEAISEAQKSSRGWHFYKLLKIIPGDPKPYEKVKFLIRLEKKNNVGGELLFNLSSKVEDELAGGASLEEVAKAFNLKIKTIDNIAQDGSDKEGKMVKDIPRYKNFLGQVFEANKGDLSDIISKNDGFSYSLFRVEDIIESKERDLSEVKTKVLIALKSEKSASISGEFSKKISDEVKAGKKIEDKAKEVGLKVEKSKDLYRESPERSDIPEALRVQLFDMKVGEVTQPFQDVYGNYIVAVLDEIKVADKEDTKTGLVTITEEITEDYQDDMKMQYIEEIQKKHPVTYFLENTAILQNIMQDERMMDYIDKSKR